MVFGSSGSESPPSASSTLLDDLGFVLIVYFLFDGVNLLHTDLNRFSRNPVYVAIVLLQK
jgi:hypothetical protein